MKIQITRCDGCGIESDTTEDVRMKIDGWIKLAAQFTPSVPAYDRIDGDFCPRCWQGDNVAKWLVRQNNHPRSTGDER